MGVAESWVGHGVTTGRGLKIRINEIPLYDSYLRSNIPRTKNERFLPV